MVATFNPQERAEASPTRAFFVEMLVKDVSLTSAILDLVDNCVDGATRIRPGGDFDGLYVRITISQHEFRIADNCGGISVEIAKNYAFKFGKDPRSPPTPGGVGLFGVGMKRAIFKLGRRFSVESTTRTERFRVSVDVEEWLNEQGASWTFPMETSALTEEAPEAERGTTIRVSDLYEGVVTQFDMPLFRSRLEREIAARHERFLQKNLNIRIGEHSVTPSRVVFRYVQDQLVPVHIEEQRDGVAYSLYAGVGDSDPSSAGWYVYCNGRMVVKADQTELTGWGELGVPAGGPKIPKYHHQFARFRGCVYFESEDPTKLPWKTTKDGLDVEQPLYQSVKLQMILAARPVISFLNELDRENDEPVEENKVLNELLSLGSSVLPADLPRAAAFSYRKPAPRPRPPLTVRIQYDRPKDEVELLKQCLSVTSARRAGELTFDWYLRNECSKERNR